LLLNETFPSWGYSIREGATTIWERWDGYTRESGFQTPEMNSFNHYSLGSVGDWLYRYVAGIAGDPEGPGYTRITIRPHPGGEMTFAEATYRSLHGPIACAWRIEAGTFTLEVTIPANTTATVYLPTSDAKSVREGEQPIGEAEGVRLVGHEGGRAMLTVGSGTYRFTADRASG
jgi:alpha-L-rhamnosidase